MSKHTTVKVILGLLLLFTLTACASVASFSRPANDFTINPDIKYAKVELPQVEFPMPLLEVEELPVPIQALHERARIVITPAETRCMAKAIYFEAKSEPFVGQVAVGYIVLNRIADGRFGHDICSTVTQKTRGRCEFSWHCTNYRIRNQEAFARAERVALQVMRRELDNPIDNRLFFNAHLRGTRYANETRIGNHRFFRSFTVARI